MSHTHLGSFAKKMKWHWHFDSCYSRNVTLILVLTFQNIISGFLIIFFGCKCISVSELSFSKVNILKFMLFHNSGFIVSIILKCDLNLFFIRLFSFVISRVFLSDDGVVMEYLRISSCKKVSMVSVCFQKLRTYNLSEEKHRLFREVERFKDISSLWYSTNKSPYLSAKS